MKRLSLFSNRAVDEKDAGRKGPQRTRLTILFACTALVVIAIATIVVNLVIGNLAEDNLLRIAEENTARDALHIQSMRSRV